MFKRLGKNIKKFGSSVKDFAGLYKLSDDFTDTLGRTVRRDPPGVSKVLNSRKSMDVPISLFRGSGVGNALNNTVFDSNLNAGRKLSEVVNGSISPLSYTNGNRRVSDMFISSSKSIGSSMSEAGMKRIEAPKMSKDRAKEILNNIDIYSDSDISSARKVMDGISDTGKKSRLSMNKKDRFNEARSIKKDNARDVLNNIDIHSDKDIRNAKITLGMETDPSVSDIPFSGTNPDRMRSAAFGDIGTDYVGSNLDPSRVRGRRRWKQINESAETFDSGSFTSGVDPFDKKYKKAIPKSHRTDPNDFGGYNFSDEAEGFLGTDKVKNYMGNKYDSTISSGIDDLKKARGTVSDDDYRSMIENFNDSVGFRQRDGISRERFDADKTSLINSLQEGRYDDAKELLGRHKKGYINEANAVDAAFAYKVPQVGLGALGTAAIVSNMSSSKGQQSNAELYGQQTPYG